jgi:hypothetical protein
MSSFLDGDDPRESLSLAHPSNRSPFSHPEWDFQSRVNFAYRGLPASFRPLWRVRLWKGTPVAKVRSVAPDWYDMVLDEFPVVPVEGPLADPEFFDPWYVGASALPPGDPGTFRARAGAYGFASEKDALDWSTHFRKFVETSPYSPIAIYDLFYGVTADSNYAAVRARMKKKLAAETHRYPGYGRDSHFFSLFRGFAQKPSPSPSGVRSFFSRGTAEYSVYPEKVSSSPAPGSRTKYKWSAPILPLSFAVNGYRTQKWVAYKQAIRDASLRFGRYAGARVLPYGGRTGSWTSREPLTPGLRYTAGKVSYMGMVDMDRTKLRPYRGKRSHWMGNNPYSLTPRDPNQGRYLWYLRDFGDRYLTGQES